MLKKKEQFMVKRTNFLKISLLMMIFVIFMLMLSGCNMGTVTDYAKANNIKMASIDDLKKAIGNKKVISVACGYYHSLNH
jgi:hypothetical protein